MFNMINLKLINRLSKYIFKKKLYRRLILIFGDTLISQLAILFALILSKESLNITVFSDFYLLRSLFLLVSFTTYIVTGQYSSLTSYLGLKIFLKIFLRNLLSIIIVEIICNFILGSRNSISFLSLIVINTTFLNLCFRYLIRKFLFLYSENNQNIKTKIAIYGAGMSGINLAKNLDLLGGYDLVAFIDEDSQLWSRNIGGIPIISPLMVNNLNGKVDRVLISIENISRSKKVEIIRKFQQLNISVFTIPSIGDFASGKTSIHDLNTLNIPDLIFRKEFTSQNKLLFKLIENKTILISGAGGSVGSELCIQILKYRPKKLILLERSEINLYEVEQTLLEKNINNINLVFVLGCAMNKKVIERIFSKEEIQIVFHTAAYKHVPIVENNPISGIENNVITTKVLCDASIKYKLENFCLISTDKAVRPTNIMGASKRLAELIVQSYSKTSDSNSNKGKFRTCFSMVRFGNVLDSSGSVVPRFRQQIKKGGPITITHPKITRFFMTISEAANLVLESISYAEGGDLFLLDMGNPILIKDLATQMIKLSGLEIKSEDNPKGDIEIIYTGLRPGEKLYEELLIDAEALATKNSNIFRAKENFFSSDIFLIQLEKMQKALLNEDVGEALSILKEVVPEWSNQES